MGSTKIINVLKNDRFEELLDIIRNTDASEVVFILPKKTSAFQSESQFEILQKETEKDNKVIAFLCSNTKTNELAKKYNFEILSTKTNLTPKSPGSKPTATLAATKNSDLDDNVDEEEENQENEDEFEKSLSGGRDEPEEEIVSPKTDESRVDFEQEDDKDYKEEEKEEEIVEENAPYGTEVDESGNPVYDEEEDTAGEPIASDLATDFQVITASAKSRGMSDIVSPKANKHIKVSQKNKGNIKLEARVKETDIQSVFSKEANTDNIWADIYKPHISKRSFFKKNRINSNSKNFPKSIVAVLSVISIFIFGFIIFLTMGNARIEIKPRSQAINTQLRVVISPNFTSVNNSLNRIPGQLFTVNKSSSNNFNATAEKDAIQKSRGIITIYNEYSTSPQPLVATTRFEYIKNNKGISPDTDEARLDDPKSGLVFRTLQTITVPGMKVENGIVTPGKINVEVIADKAGQSYNISPGNFGIVAWREKGDTARYQKIYGRSTDSMHGGILGKAKVVSEFDYNNAKDSLTSKVTNDINEALKAQSSGLELFDNVKPKIDSIESTAKIDDAVDSFTMTVNGSVVTMGYKKENLIELIANHVEKTNTMVAIAEKLELSYKDAVVNPTTNTLEVVVTIKGDTYAKIDRENIITNLIGKNEFQIKDYLGAIQDIDSAKVTLSPFWVKKIPKNKNKVDISLTY